MLLNSQHLLGWKERNLDTRVRQKNYKHRTAIVSAVLYGCVSWSLTLMEEYRMRAMRTEC
jgi:hypothetical protein